MQAAVQGCHIGLGCLAVCHTDRPGSHRYVQVSSRTSVYDIMMKILGGILEALLTLKVTAKPRFSSQLQILAANLFTKDCYLSSDVSNRLTLKVTAIKLIPSPLKLRANDFNLVFSKLCYL